MTSQDNSRVLVPPPMIFAGLLALGLLIGNARNASGAVQLEAIAMGLAGLIPIVLALGLIRSNKTPPEPWQPASALVITGIFHLTRNPMYLGMAILSLSMALLCQLRRRNARTNLRRDYRCSGNSAGEAYMNRRFGDEYVVYRKAVRRWI